MSVVGVGEEAPPVHCNPKAKPPERCPGGVACPSSGICPTKPPGPPSPPGPSPSPPPPGPPGTYTCSNSSVIKGATIFASATLYDGVAGNGCGECDCCHDYISDCDLCVNTRCVVNSSSKDYYACSMYVHQGKVDNQRHKPVPICYRHKGGNPNDPSTDEIDANKNMPTGRFNSSRCDGKCGHDNWEPPERPLPAGPHNCTAQAKSGGYPNGEGPWPSDCDTCSQCCRDDVDCEKCVKEECPPPGTWFLCTGAHGGRHGNPAMCTPLQNVPMQQPPLWQRQQLFATHDCNKTCVPWPNPPGKGSYTCFGNSCKMIPGSWLAGKYTTPTCDGMCGKPPPPPPPPQPKPPPVR